MWPFKHKSEPESDYIVNVTPDARLKAFRDIGETFNYLGRECVVTGHGKLVGIGLAVVYQSELCADYCDNNGVIRQIKFSLSELPILIKQNGGK